MTEMRSNIDGNLHDTQESEDFLSFSDGYKLKSLVLAEQKDDSETVKKLISDLKPWQRRIFKAIRRYDDGQLLNTLKLFVPVGVLWQKLKFGSWGYTMSTHCYEVCGLGFAVDFALTP